MMIKQTFLRMISALLCLGTVALGVQAQTSPCPNAPPTRLEPLTNARVTPGAPNNVRGEPDLQAEIVGQVPGDAVFNLLSDSVCADGYLWWEVAYQGTVGWMAEGYGDTYYVEPYTEPAPQSVAAEANAVLQVSEAGVSFSVPLGLATDITVQSRVGYGLPGSARPRPNYLAFALVDYVVSVEEFHSLAEIEIYPMDGFEAIYGQTPLSIAELQKRLDQRPTLDALTGDFPVLPEPNAVQLFRAQADYLEFENGAGIRYLTVYVQNMVEITAGLRYQFSGITDDGKGYVIASFPVEVPETVFPAFSYDEFLAADEGGTTNPYYDAYVEELGGNLNAESTANFEPNLETLDAIIESLRVEMP